MNLSALLRRRWPIVAAVLALAIILAVLLALTARGSDADVVVYNGRSHYGDEQVFKRFEEQTGLDVELRGGTAPELFERLRREGDETPADVLITTDLANLWRAKEAGLLQPLESPELRRHVPPDLRDDEGQWWALSTRVRTVMRSTERVPEDAIKTYADLGDPRWKGRTCLRTSNNEYNQSLVADMIAKHGKPYTERMLRSWMDNDPQILGSDVDVLDAIAAGRCDVGLTNHYYLGRELKDDPDFPVAPVWVNQRDAGAHTNVSGVGMVKGAEHGDAAVRLMEYLTSIPAQREIVANSEFAANPKVPPPAHIREWDDVKLDPIAVAEAGRHLDDAVALMQQVGWQ